MNRNQKAGIAVAIILAIAGVLLLLFVAPGKPDSQHGFPPVLLVAIYLPFVAVFVAAARRRRKDDG